MTRESCAYPELDTAPSSDSTRFGCDKTSYPTRHSHNVSAKQLPTEKIDHAMTVNAANSTVAVEIAVDARGAWAKADTVKFAAGSAIGLVRCWWGSNELAP